MEHLDYKKKINRKVHKDYLQLDFIKTQRSQSLVLI